MITALMIVGGLSATSTLVIIGGLLAARRAQHTEFEAGEIAFSTPQTHRENAAAPAFAPAFSH